MEKLFYLFTIILLMSCGNNSSNSDFRKELDKIKKEELPKQDVSITSFEIDTLGEIKYTSEIKTRLKQGQQSIKIITECKYDGNKLAKVESHELKNSYFEGQRIIEDKNGDDILIYMIKDKKNENRIFEIHLSKENLELKEVSKEREQWKTFKSKIIEKNLPLIK